MTEHTDRAAKAQRAILTAQSLASEPYGGRLVADVLAEADTCANWSRVRTLIHQRAQILESRSSFVPEVLEEAIADTILQVSWSYIGLEKHMYEHALAILADVAQQENLD